MVPKTNALSIRPQGLQKSIQQLFAVLPHLLMMVCVCGGEGRLIQMKSRCTKKQCIHKAHCPSSLNRKVKQCVFGHIDRTVCPSGLRGWTQVPLARAAWAQIPTAVKHVSKLATLDTTPSVCVGLCPSLRVLGGFEDEGARDLTTSGGEKRIFCSGKKQQSGKNEMANAHLQMLL